MKFKIIALLIAASLSACNSLDVVNSKPLENNLSYARYDSESKVRYNVYNNNTHLQIILSTNDKSSLANILKGGLTIYMNDEGKKKKTTYVTYPIDSQDERRETPSEGEPKGNRPPDLNRLVHEVPKTKLYAFQGNEQRLSLNEGDIDIKLFAKGTELFYELLIPFDKISNLPKAELHEILIGVVSGNLEMPEGRSGPSGGGRMPGGNGQGGPQGSGGGRQGSSGGRPDMETGSSSVDFWFKVIVN